MGGYDPLNNETARRFATLKNQTACIFAKKAKVWGMMTSSLSHTSSITSSLVIYHHPHLINYVTSLSSYTLVYFPFPKGAPWDDNLTLKENYKKCIPVLANYVKTIKLYVISLFSSSLYLLNLHRKKFIDAIVIEARGSKYGNSVDQVSKTLRTLCNILSENDPCHSRFMDLPPDAFPYWSLTFGIYSHPFSSPIFYLLT